jgi:hypothetical protein
MSKKFTVDKEDYTDTIDQVLAYYTETKISRIFEMSVDMSDGDWDNEEEYGNIFDEYTKDLTRIGGHFDWELIRNRMLDEANREYQAEMKIIDEMDAILNEKFGDRIKDELMEKPKNLTDIGSVL